MGPEINDPSTSQISEIGNVVSGGMHGRAGTLPNGTSHAISNGYCHMHAQVQVNPMSPPWLLFAGPRERCLVVVPPLILSGLWRVLGASAWQDFSIERPPMCTWGNGTCFCSIGRKTYMFRKRVDGCLGGRGCVLDLDSCAWAELPPNNPQIGFYKVEDQAFALDGSIYVFGRVFNALNNSRNAQRAIKFDPTTGR